MGGSGKDGNTGAEVPPNPIQSPQNPNGWTAGGARGQKLAQGEVLGQCQASHPAVLFMLVFLPVLSSSPGCWETDGKCVFILFSLLFERPAVQCVHSSTG